MPNSRTNYLATQALPVSPTDTTAIRLSSRGIREAFVSLFTEKERPPMEQPITLKFAQPQGGPIFVTVPWMLKDDVVVALEATGRKLVVEAA